MSTPVEASPRREIPGVIVLMAVTFLARAFFLYRNGVGDPDSMVMAAGMAAGLNSDAGFAETILYGRQVNPGMYLVTRAVYPLLFDNNVHLVGFLNWFNLAAFTLCVWLMYSMLRKMVTPAAAAGTIVLFVFSPVAWESGTYFHPLIPAVTLLISAMLAWTKIGRSPAGIAFFLLTFAAGSAAVIMRASVFFLVPAFFVWALLSTQKGRNILLITTLTSLVFITYFFAETTVFDSVVERRGLSNYASYFFDTYLRNYFGPALVKQLVWATLSVGVTTILLFIVTAWRRFRLRRTRDAAANKRDLHLFVFTAAWVLPSLLFWLPSPVPIMRHYLLPAMGVSWFAGYLLFSSVTARRAWGIIIVAILTNLAVPEIAYRTFNKVNAASAKEPHGTFFYYHEIVNGRVARFNRMQRTVMDVVRKSTGNRRDAATPGVFVEADWEGYGYLLYAMATTGLPMRKISETRDRERVHFHRYKLGGAEVRLVQCFPRDAGRKDVVSERIRKSIAEGYVVFLPAESIKDVYELSELGGDVEAY